MPKRLHCLLETAGYCYWRLPTGTTEWVFVGADCPQNCCHPPISLFEKLVHNVTRDQLKGIEVEVQGSFQGTARLRLATAPGPHPARNAETRAPGKDDIIICLETGDLMAITECQC